MATFDGVSFDMEMPRYPRSRRANVDVRPVPGGDTFYVDNMGKLPATIRPGIGATDANYAALEGKLGAQYSLVYEGGTVTAILMEISNGERYDDDYMRGEAEFLLI